MALPCPQHMSIDASAGNRLASVRNGEHGRRAIYGRHCASYNSLMTALPQTRLTVDEYLSWAEAHPGRYELHDGVVYQMSPEGAGHAKAKAAVHAALLAGVRERGLPCHVLPDGMTVRIDTMTAYETAALVSCGPELLPTAIEVPAPVIVAEVLSPSTRHTDLTRKPAAQFRPPRVAHSV